MSFLLSPDNLIWNRKEVSYTSNFATHPNRTANLAGNDFVWLPHILAAELSKPGLKFDLDGQRLQFYRAIPSNGNGVELISWQPLNYTEDEKTYYYSVVLTLTVITVPNQPYPQLHITPSIRRWLSINDSSLSNNHGSTAYILSNLNWGQALNPDDNTECFISCQMLLTNNQAEWNENVARLLQELNILSITPQQILINPSVALTGNPNISITCNDGMEPEHLVAKGLPTVNTHELLQQIDNELKDYLEPIYYQRQEYQTSKQSNQFFGLPKPKKSFDEPIVRKKAETEKQFEYRRKKLLQKQETELKNCIKRKRDSEPDYQIRREELLKKQEQTRLECKLEPEETEEAFKERLRKFYQKLSVKQAELRKAICSSIGELTIWLWYIREDNLVERLKAIQYCLGLPDAAAGIHSFPEGLTVNICVQEAGSIAERLDLPTKRKPNHTQRETAVNDRKSQIADIVQPVQPELLGKVGVWFELYGKESWNKYPWCDPKNAVRLGFADVWIGSQFITPERKSYHQKAISDFIDLLRFLGVRLSPSRITLSNPNVDENTPINEVGLWLVNRTSRTSATGRPQLIPVMVKMSSLTAEISAIYPGLETWIPYEEASLRINQDGINFTNDAQGKAKIRNWIKDILKKKELRDKPTILYCEAENLRQVWTWLQDTQISADGLSFVERDNPVFMPMPGLRVIRCRSGDETAEYYGIDGEEISGFTTGIFKNQDNERVFLSVGSKSATMSGITKNLSRIENPEKNWQHPSLVELTIGYCQEGDNLLDLAAIAHQSRQGVLQYEGFLKRPRVLHYAEQMADYVLMLDEDSQSDNRL